MSCISRAYKSRRAIPSGPIIRALFSTACISFSNNAPVGISAEGVSVSHIFYLLSLPSDDHFVHISDFHFICTSTPVISLTVIFHEHIIYADSFHIFTAYAFLAHQIRCISAESSVCLCSRKLLMRLGDSPAEQFLFSRMDGTFLLRRLTAVIRTVLRCLHSACHFWVVDTAGYIGAA